jgi:hypothetical protein
MTLGPGRHLGYCRLGPHGGTWVAKLRDPANGRRWKAALGPADDTLDAGADVLTFAEAQEMARRLFGA